MDSSRSYGSSGFRVSALGLGAAQLGDARVSEAETAKLLATAIDAGITLLDTAPGYGESEERIGRHLGSHRHQVIVSTKLGYGVDGIADWTAACITAGVEQALQRLRIERIDIAHLHSCPREVLERSGVVDALERARTDGKVAAIAYSGENDDLACAVAMQRFDGFMASLNLFDQRVIDEQLPLLAGKGFIAKRPSANHPWRFPQAPVGDYCEPYWRRWQQMGLDSGGLAWGELALRFALSFDAVGSAIVGTANAAHLRQNIAWAAKGALPQETVALWRDAFRAHDQDWTGQV